MVSMMMAAGASAASRHAATPTFSAHGSAEQVYVTGLAPNARMSLLNSNGQTRYTQSADSLGGLLFRNVPPGSGYRVRLDPHGAESGPLTVYSNAAAPWDPGIYNQSIPDNGYTYLTMRDGTQLAIDVHPPTSPAGEPGLPGTPGLPGLFGLPGGIHVPASADYAPPYPTLIEYSGYGYADPAGPVNGIAVLANLMGFAVVDISMRGTGCSGGAYDFFEHLQNLDGYDAIETIAHQPWVLGHKVGMMGISYGAISQLFTAQLNPPDLEAISPLSTIDTTATTLYPGGILNDGFAVAWAQERQHEAQVAGAPGTQAYAEQQIQQGDQTCKANQVLHGEAADLLAKIRANSHYVPTVADPLDPITFVNKINVPVFMACQWEDEQTGGHCPDLAEHFTGTKQKWFTFTNGAHVDSLDPYTYNRWYDFLELFVAHQAPIVNQLAMRVAAPVIYQGAMGLPMNDVVTMPSDPIQQEPTYQSALAAFDALPSVRVLFDSGAGQSPSGGGVTPGNPYPGFEQSFSTLPVPGTTARSWYLAPSGTLADQPPTPTGIDSYASNAGALPLHDYGSNTGGGGLWGNASQWQWQWQQNPPGTAVSYVSAPLTTNTTVVGAGAVHLWVRSSTPDVDLQATISEVRPDGNETFVQNGWLRASGRKLATSPTNLFKQESSVLEPIPSELAADVQPMPQDRFVEVVIPLYYEGHVYRAGSRVRVTIAAPNGTQPIWSFSHTQPNGTAKVSIAFSNRMPSSLIFPVVPGVSVPTSLPPCPGLRNEPCRTYVAINNEIGGANPPMSPGCPRATGRLHGSTLGLLTLGMTRARTRRAYKHSSDRGSRYKDFFCLTPIGVRAGYASPNLLKTLPRRLRKQLKGRVVWASTANPYYSLRGIRAGSSLAKAAKKLHTGAPFHIGRNYWYLAANGSSTAVLKVRHKRVEEIGIANKHFTHGRKAQRTLMKSFD
jgi:predicted acyl esterase